MVLIQVRDLIPFANSLGFAVEEYAAGKGKIPPRLVIQMNKKCSQVSDLRCCLLSALTGLHFCIGTFINHFLGSHRNLVLKHVPSICKLNEHLLG